MTWAIYNILPSCVAEYTMGSAPSRKGDVYSFGILVLEIFTGRRPTNEMSKDGFNLHSFVRRALQNGLEQIVDSAVLPREVEETTATTEQENSCNKSEDFEIELEDESIHFENPNQMNTNLEKCWSQS